MQNSIVEFAVQSDIMMASTVTHFKIGLGKFIEKRGICLDGYRLSPECQTICFISCRCQKNTIHLCSWASNISLIGFYRYRMLYLMGWLDLARLVSSYKYNYLEFWEGKPCWVLIDVNYCGIHVDMNVCRIKCPFFIPCLCIAPKILSPNSSDTWNFSILKYFPRFICVY